MSNSLIIDPVELFISFDRKAYCRMVRRGEFDFWLRTGSIDSPVRRISAPAWRELIEGRKAFFALPLQFNRDGMDVVICLGDQPTSEEWARIRSETLRSFIQRAAGVCKNKKAPSRNRDGAKM